MVTFHLTGEYMNRAIYNMIEEDDRVSEEEEIQDIPMDGNESPSLPGQQFSEVGDDWSN